MYNIWETHYEFTKRQVRETRKDFDITIDDYYKLFLKHDKPTITIASTEVNSRKFEKLQVDAEVAWLKKGKPYYNIKSNIIEPAMKMNLSKIPCALLDSPRDFPSVNIRFPLDDEILGVLTFKQDRIIYLLYKLKPVYTGFLVIPLDDIRSLDEYIEHFEDKVLMDSAVTKSRAKIFDLVKKILKVYVTVKFLSDVPNDDLMDYDVLSKHRNEYHDPKTTAERRLELEKKAKQEGKIGWNIGVKEKVYFNIPQWSSSNNSEEIHRELQHAHIRTGHLHAVRFGPKRQHVKIMFYRPTVVRKDLPFA